MITSFNNMKEKSVCSMEYNK